MECFFFLRILPPPISSRTDTLFPSTTLFRSRGHFVLAGGGARGGPGVATRRCRRGKAARALHHHVRAFGVARTGAQRGDRAGRSRRGGRDRESIASCRTQPTADRRGRSEIGRAHV